VQCAGVKRHPVSCGSEERDYKRNPHNEENEE
jgi:hypothetical protein